MEQLPVLGGESKEEVVPANAILLPEQASGLGIENGWLNGLAMLVPKLVETGLENCYDVRVGVSLNQVVHKRSKVLLPGGVGIFSLT